ncbi:MAG TPA: hypothetical protein VHG28_24690 [Longimicrobiaceae bacterium]|nr:hypothetical protein [Longimicrobiaceae bacterium]
MRVLYALLCEDAHMRPDGRADLLGVFHHLFAPGFPARQDRMTLVLVLEWTAEEVGRVNFKIDLLDPSSTPVGTISGHTEVGTPGSLQPPQQTRLVMSLDNVVFPAAGAYEFELDAGGRKERIAVLHLIENPDAR